MTIRTVLAATDFSPSAARALARAGMLAAAHGARLVVAHAVPEGWLATLRAWASARTIAESAEADIEVRLAAEATALAATHRIEAEPWLAHGDPRRVLPEVAAGVAADLLVVGAHGVHFVREWLLGSTAIAVLAAAPCPVLAVRRDSVQAYRDVLVGCDFSPASRDAVGAAAQLAPDAQLALLHAYEDPYGSALALASVPREEIDRYRDAARADAERALDQFRARLGPLGERCSKLLRYGPPVLRFVEELEARGADLAVLGSRRKSALEGLMLGSVASEVALGAPCDVLLAREGRRMVT
jgi:nucleotide-binding universal stress UspA family protein